jgi:predicted dehydrogenase
MGHYCGRDLIKALSLKYQHQIFEVYMINLGFIGYGYWGPNLVRNFFNTREVKVAQICDLRQARLDLIKDSYPFVKTSLDYKELMKDPQIDALVISTPVSTHFPLSQEALQNGKHVLLEKPMTATIAEAEKLIELAEKKKKVLMVDHTFLYNGAVRKMKQLIEANELGELLYFDSVRVNLGLFQHDVNVIWDLAPHDFAIMDYLLNIKPEAISANGACHFGNLENIAYITIQYPHGLIAHIHVNWLAPVKVRTTLIGGNKKMIVYNDNEPSEKVKIYDSGVNVTAKSEDAYQMLIQYRIGDMLAPRFDSTEALKLVSREFVEAIQHNRKPLTDGENGLRVVKLLEKANQSLAQKGKTIAL